MRGLSNNLTQLKDSQLNRTIIDIQILVRCNIIYSTIRFSLGLALVLCCLFTICLNHVRKVLYIQKGVSKVISDDDDDDDYYYLL